MDELKNILEALIFISVEPLTLEKIKEVLNDVPEEEILRKRGEIANLIQVTLSHLSQLICIENIKN